jgi:hypothetical protein
MLRAVEGLVLVVFGVLQLERAVESAPFGLDLLGGVAVALLFAYAWSWVMAALGLVVRTPEAVQAPACMGVFPLAFTSSVFVPVQTMPGWLQGVRRQPAGHRGHQRAARADPRPRRLPRGWTVTGQVLLALA